MTNCNFTNNKATGDNSYGGAILFSGAGNVTNCNFANNSANSYGGAVYFLYESTVTNCNFVNNSADYGGAVRLDSGSIENCNFVNNSASERGGAVYLYKNRQGTLTNCNFTNNSADRGGAIMFEGNGTVTNCSFNLNTALRGGALYVHEYSSSSVANCNFTDNAAKGGGAICFDFNGTVTNCNFTGNNASFGSAIYFNSAKGTKTISDSCFLNNRADADSLEVTQNENILTIAFIGKDNLLNAIYSDGNVSFTNVIYWGANGIANTGSSVVSRFNKEAGQNITVEVYDSNDQLVDNVTLVTDNNGQATFDFLKLENGNYTYKAYHSEDSYYTYTEKNGTFNLTLGDFTRLQKIINGAEDNSVISLYRDYIFTVGSDESLKNGIVIDKPITINGNGHTINALQKARIFNIVADNVVLENIAFVNGNATEGIGGAIWFDNFGTVINCNFANNYARYEAGAVRMDSGSLENCNFNNNKADTSGGAVYFYDDGVVTNCNFTDNNAYQGGAIYFANYLNPSAVINCNFNNNTAKSYGGAVYFYDNGNVINCNFVNNTAELNGGAVYFDAGGSVENCNFTGNNASEGSAIYFYSDSATQKVSNSIFLNNSADAESLEVIKNENNITIIFKGKNNLLNAIYSNGDVSFTNVTYWGADGIDNTGNAPVIIPASKYEAGQTLSISVLVDNILIVNTTKATDSEGKIVVGDIVAGNCIISVASVSDAYYSLIETVKLYQIPGESSDLILETSEDKVIANVASGAVGNVTFTVKNESGIIKVVDVMLNESTAELDLSDLDYGRYVINVVYRGNIDYRPSEDNMIYQMRAPSSITINVNSTYKVGEDIVITLVPVNLTNPTVKINGEEKKVINNTVTINGGLANGTYIIEAVLAGDEIYTGSSDIKSFNVVRNDVGIDMAVDIGSPTNMGTPVTFTVNVDKDATGIVKFELSDGSENETVYVDVINGKAVLGDVLDAGEYTVVATYMGDSKYSTNVTSESFNVKGYVKQNTSISADVKINGYCATITVNVDSNATGFVMLTLADSLYYSVLENGVASINNTLPAGSYNVVISYLGDENYNGNGTSIEFTISEVAKENTTIGLNVEIDENDVKYVVDVNPDATGIVKFEVTGVEQYTVYADVIGGKAILDDVLAAGDYTVVATYMGDSRFNTNITTESFSVKGHVKVDTPIGASVLVNGYRVSITVKVDSNATGFVSVKLGDTIANIALTNGSGSFITTLIAGSYHADLTYLGDENYNTNSTAVLFTIIDPVKENTPISLNVSVGENNVKYTVDVNPDATGIVKFEVTGTEAYVVYADVVGGKAILDDILTEGDYTVVATYLGDSKYNANVTSESFSVKGHVKQNTTINASVKINGYCTTITVNVDSNATGFVILTFGGSTYYSALENGVASINNTLPAGSYNVAISYLGDGDYNGNSTSLEFVIADPVKENTNISLSVEIDENDVKYVVDVNPDATGIVKFEVTGVEQYTVYADVIGGKAILDDVLAAGDYTVVATYMGDSRFNTNITTESFSVKGHVKVDTPIGASVLVNGYRVSITVKVDSNATGFVSVKLGDTIANIALTNGSGSFITTLIAGSYHADLTYLGDENYNTNSTAVLFTIIDPVKENTPISLNVSVGENNVKYTVDVNPDATGIVKFVVTGTEEYTVYADVISGKAVLEDVLDDGNYTVIATYMGDSRFNTNVTSFDFTIIRPDINITIPEISQGESSVVDVELPSDATGVVSVLVDGKEVSNATVTNGSAKVTVPELVAGNHTVEVKYSGDGKYAAVIKTSSVNVKMDVPVNSTSIKVTLAVGSKSPKFNITLPDDAKGYVVVSINGVDYFAAVENGTAIVSVPSLAYGSYGVNVIYSGDDKYNSLMKNTAAKIPKPKLTAKNISIVYTNPYKYQVRVTIDGKAVVKQYVTFKFNGKTYKRLTNSKGYATLTLPKVAPKKAKYTITMKYNDISLSKKIKVNSIVVAKNLKVKKSVKALKIKVKLKKVAKKVQKGKRITLEFKGKKYKAKTNKKGVATFTIKNKVYKKLKTNKKYTYRVIYGKDKVKKTIKFKK